MLAGRRGACDGAAAMPLLPALVLAAAVSVSGGWVRPPPPGAPAAAAYLTLANTGRIADRLTGARSPDAERVEVHAMSLEGGVMRMRPAPGVELPAGGAVSLAPGGLHLMLIGPKRAFRTGDTVAVTLSLARGGEVQAVLPVRTDAPR